jgi:peptidyl-prolyl cis-trans isomerase C
MFRLLLPVLGLALLAPPTFAQDAPDPNPVVAIVNGEEVRRDEVLAAAEDLPEQFRQVPLSMIFQPLLDRVIDTRLLAAEAERRDVAAMPEVAAALARARAGVMRDALIESTVEAGLSEEALRARYETLRAAPEFKRHEVSARHILVETEEEAIALIEELQAGAEFEALAERSIEPGAGERGGDLGFFRKEQMVPAFGEAAFALEVGAITEVPVETQFGWHVIRVDDRRDREPSFEEVETQLRQQVARDVVTSLLEGVRAGAEVTRFAIDGSPLPEPEDEPKAAD